MSNRQPESVYPPRKTLKTCTLTEILLESDGYGVYPSEIPPLISLPFWPRCLTLKRSPWAFRHDLLMITAGKDPLRAAAFDEVSEIVSVPPNKNERCPIRPC